MEEMWEYFLHMTSINPGSTWFSLLVVWWWKTHSPEEEKNFKDSNSFLGNHEEKARTQQRSWILLPSPPMLPRTALLKHLSPTPPHRVSFLTFLPLFFLTPDYMQSYNPSPSDSKRKKNPCSLGGFGKEGGHWADHFGIIFSSLGKRGKLQTFPHENVYSVEHSPCQREIRELNLYRDQG